MDIPTPLLLQIVRLRDGGPLYAETNLDNLVAEPFNAASAFLFLLMAFYWIFRLRGQYRAYRFLTVAIAVLTIGGIGGTIYHAFRYSQVFLVMDWLPIMLLCLMASGFYLHRAYGSLRPALYFVGALFLLQFLNFQVIGLPQSVNVSYALLALTVLSPTFILLVKTNFKAGAWVASALGSFVLALFFRIADTWEILPMGTHFLWHLFGATAAMAMLQYTYLAYGFSVARSK